MRIHPALLSALLVAPCAVSLAAAGEFTTTGTVVATGHDTLVVRIDDHGHRIPFAVDKPGVLPAGVAVGSRVSVVYHPTGVTGQAADSVKLLSAPAPAAPRPTKRPASRQQPAAEKVGQLSLGQPNT